MNNLRGFYGCVASRKTTHFKLTAPELRPYKISLAFINNLPGFYGSVASRKTTHFKLTARELRPYKISFAQRSRSHVIFRPQAYSEPCQTSKMERFARTSQVYST